MRVPENQFVTNCIDHFIQGELVLFCTNFCIKNNVEQQIPQLFFYAFPVIISNGISEFIGFFNSKLAETSNGLLFIPGALLPQVVHNIYQSVKSFICST